MTRSQKCNAPNAPHKVLIVGAGPHFAARYFPVLERLASTLEIEIPLVIDLESQRERVRRLFTHRRLTPSAFIFLPDEFRNIIDPDVIENAVAGTVDISDTHSVLICTEPKAHTAYALWACRHRINVFLDKPLSAFHAIAECDQLLNDFDRLSDAQRRSGVNFVVACERRANPGYLLLRRILAGLIREHRIPITHIDIRFGGGKWIQKHEFAELENHPFKYGYGTLLHSGYHYVDLLCTLIELNRLVPDGAHDEIAFEVIARTAADFTPALLQGGVALMPDALSQQHAGELDLIVAGATSRNGRTFTTFVVSLIESTVSRRSDATPLQDYYIDGGRSRQEDLWLHLGPLCSLRIASYPYRKFGQRENAEEQFDIEIFRNAALLGGPSYMKVGRRHLSAAVSMLALESGLNVWAREAQLQDFLQGGDSASSLETHANTVAFVTDIYRAIRSKVSGR